MVYIGYPISFETACALFGIVYSQDYDKLNTALDAHLEKYGLKLYFYDKGVFILGMVIKELWVGNDKYVPVNDALELMVLYKKQVIESLSAAGADLTEFNIEIMEGEPIRVYNPQPYAIS